MHDRFQYGPVYGGDGNHSANKRARKDDKDDQRTAHKQDLQVRLAMQGRLWVVIPKRRIEGMVASFLAFLDFYRIAFVVGSICI